MVVGTGEWDMDEDVGNGEEGAGHGKSGRGRDNGHGEKGRKRAVGVGKEGKGAVWTEEKGERVWIREKRERKGHGNRGIGEIWTWEKGEREGYSLGTGAGGRRQAHPRGTGKEQLRGCICGVGLVLGR